MLKCWALMGISCGATGLVHITDMDHIEKSNLSRQFLFRNADINHPKSATASRAVKAINPAMHIRPYENKVAPETEEIFNDDFYDSIDMICTALDNVEARLYVDQRCLFYQKPMLESGTLGTKGNTQVVVPGVTENYGATRDPPEQSIPVCTLKHFPNNIAHTLQVAYTYDEILCLLTVYIIYILLNIVCVVNSGLASGSRKCTNRLLRTLTPSCQARQPDSSSRHLQHSKTWYHIYSRLFNSLHIVIIYFEV